MMRHNFLKGLLFCGGMMQVMHGMDFEAMKDNGSTKAGCQELFTSQQEQVCNSDLELKNSGGIHTQASGVLSVNGKLIGDHEQFIDQSSSDLYSKSHLGDCFPQSNSLKENKPSFCATGTALGSDSEYGLLTQAKDEFTEEEIIENITTQQSSTNLGMFADGGVQGLIIFDLQNKDKFYTLSKDKVKNLTSVTFRNLEIDQAFADQFQRLFCDGLIQLVFDNCTLDCCMEYYRIFPDGYIVGELEIIDNYQQFTNCDAVAVYMVLRPWTLGRVYFSGELLEEKSIIKALSVCPLSPDGILFILKQHKTP